MYCVQNTDRVLQLRNYTNIIIRQLFKLECSILHAATNEYSNRQLITANKFNKISKVIHNPKIYLWTSNTHTPTHTYARVHRLFIYAQKYIIE